MSDAPSAGSRSSLVRRLWAAPIAAHLGALALVLIAIVALTGPGGGFTPDEGGYQLQLRALDAGSWVWHSGTERYDPTGSHFPIRYAEPSPDGFVPLAKHPAWPWLAHQTSRLTGPGHAYDVLAVLGLLLAAAAAWWLAGEHEDRWRRPAFWLTGTAPVAATIALGWAHAPSVAFAGLAVLGAVRLVRRGLGRAAIGPAVLLVSGVAAGCLVRTEGVLLALALALACLVGGWRAGRWGAGGLGAALTVAGVAVTTRLEDRWIHHITGAGSSTFNPRSGESIATSGLIDARYQGAVRSLLDPAGRVATLILLALLVAAAVLGAGIVAGRARLVPAWQACTGAALVVLVLRVLAVPVGSGPGLLIGWPIVLIGVAAALTALVARLPLESTVIVLYVGAVLATQYPDGGGGQWGGRFFSPILVPLAVVIALGAHRLLAAIPAEPPEGRRLTRILLVGLAVTSTALGTLVLHANRTANGRTYDRVAAEVRGVAVTPHLELPRFMWRQEVRWLVVNPTDRGADLTRLLTRLDGSGGPDRITLVLRPKDAETGRRALDAPTGWQVQRRTRVDDLTLIVLRR